MNPIPVPVSNPIKVASLIPFSIKNNSQDISCGKTLGITPWKIIWKYDAPVVFKASIIFSDVSSIVSIKVLVKYPRVTKNSAKNPVNWLCLNEKRRTKDQATRGIFLKNEAIILTNPFVKRFIPVASEPINAKNNAKIDDTIVEETANKIVSIAVLKIIGKYCKDSDVGINFWKSQIIPLGIDKKAAVFLKPEIMLEKKYKIKTINTKKILLFFLFLKISLFIFCDFNIFATPLSY